MISMRIFIRKFLKQHYLPPFINYPSKIIRFKLYIRPEYKSSNNIITIKYHDYYQLIRPELKIQLQKHCSNNNRVTYVDRKNKVRMKLIEKNAAKHLRQIFGKLLKPTTCVVVYQSVHVFERQRIHHCHHHSQFNYFLFQFYPLGIIQEAKYPNYIISYKVKLVIKFSTFEETGTSHNGI